jgi:hypothetical protein
MKFAASAKQFTFCRHFSFLLAAVCAHYLSPFDLCNNQFSFAISHLDPSSFLAPR